MKSALLPLLLALLSHLASAESPTSVAASTSSDNKDLLGQWEGFLVVGDGARASQRQSNVALTIKPGTITCTTPGNSGEGTYRVFGGNGQLRNIDATGMAGFYRGNIYRGIFSIEGDTLKWCSGDPGKARPTELRTNTAAGHYLIVLTRKR
jgi:uncharacterized protein (TIGR03067 family)